MRGRHIPEDFMSWRRITCGSGNRITQYHGEFYGSLAIIFSCITIALVDSQFSSSQDLRDCTRHCWESGKMMNYRFSENVEFADARGEQDCKDYCANKELCGGVYWGLRTLEKEHTCWLKVLFVMTAVEFESATYWSLTTCSDDCFPYCWIRQGADVQTPGGTLRNDLKDELKCRYYCSKDMNCNGVDWLYISNECYFLYMNNLTTEVYSLYVRWEIIRNLPTTCWQATEPPIIGPAEDAALATGEPMTSPAPNAGETALAVPSTVNPVGAASLAGEAVTETPVAVPSNANPPGAGAIVGESSLGNASAPGGPARGGPSVGESNLGNGPVPPVGPIGVPFTTLRDCPNYLTGIIAMAVLMGVCGLVIIGLVAYIISIRLEQANIDNPFSFRKDNRRGYQSIGTVPVTTESSEAEAP